MLCDDLEGWDTCIHIADSLCCTAETNNTVKQLYSTLGKKKGLGGTPHHSLNKRYVPVLFFTPGVISGHRPLSCHGALEILFWKKHQLWGRVRLGWAQAPLHRCLQSLKTPLKTNWDSAQLTRIGWPWHPRRPFQRVRLVPSPGCTRQHGGWGLRDCISCSQRPRATGDGLGHLALCDCLLVFLKLT